MPGWRCRGWPTLAGTGIKRQADVDRHDIFAGLAVMRLLAASLARSARGHVHEPAVVALESHGHGRGRPVAVLGHDQVRFPGPG